MTFPASARLSTGQPGPVAAARSLLSSLGAGVRLLRQLARHHIRRPTSRFSAVTSNDRTAIVSSRMPDATAKPDTDIQRARAADQAAICARVL